jgi:hypothetical protein
MLVPRRAVYIDRLPFLPQILWPTFRKIFLYHGVREIAAHSIGLGAKAVEHDGELTGMVIGINHRADLGQNHWPSVIVEYHQYCPGVPLFHEMIFRQYLQYKRKGGWRDGEAKRW